MHKHDDNGNSIISQARACKGTQDDLVIALDQLSPVNCWLSVIWSKF
jgi:hypothetical protein